MAGHSKFANIKHRKAAQDAKRTKIFSKLVKELVVAAKSGPDPDGNPRLRTAIIAAKAANLPKDRIENAIKKGSGSEGDNNYDEIRYEAYGPAGTAFIVECLTDNKNRSASSVRSIFTKYGGNLAESGSVSFMFSHKGVINFKACVASEDDMFEFAVNAGADSVESSEEIHHIQTEVSEFTNIRDQLIEKFGDPESANLEWIPNNYCDLPTEKNEVYNKLIDALDEDDDVQNYYANASFG